MMKATFTRNGSPVSASAFAKGLADFVEDVKHDVFGAALVAAEAGYEAMKTVIATDEDADASVKTDQYTVLAAEPAAGRVQSGDMLNAMDIEIETNDGEDTFASILVGTSSPKDYFFGQDTGWGRGPRSTGEKPPKGAMFHNVAGAGIRQAGFDAAAEALEAELGKL